MPPKSTVTKEAIVEQALEMTRQGGFDRITARALAASLHCSTQPIFYAFRDMKELERATARRAFARLLRSMQQPEPDTPAALSPLLRYIRFALDEKHLFALIARNGLFAPSSLPSDGMALPDARLIVLANGVVFMTMCGTYGGDWAQTRALLLSAYNGWIAAPEQSRKEDETV